MLKHYKEYEKYITSFKKVSRDTNSKISMISSNANVYNLDQLKKIYAKNNHMNLPLSNDALFITNDEHFYSIEFKNGSIDKEELLYKAFDSVIIISELFFNNSLRETKKNTDYILVYNHNKTSTNKFESHNLWKISDRISNYTNVPKQLFNLKHLKHMLYANAYTLTINEFISKFGSTFDITPT